MASSLYCVSSKGLSPALFSSPSPKTPAPIISAESHTEEKSSGTKKGEKRRVSIFWDLDNKPPKSSPYHAALHLRQVATRFGDVADMVACANRHAFLHIPRWLQEERGLIHHNLNDRRTERDSEFHDLLASSFMCGLCGITYPTRTELKKHARLSHRREWRNMAFKALESGGYGLHMELSRAGFCVRMVDQSPQAADRALKRQIKHSMSNSVQCICLVSDDSDFAEILKAARSKHVFTVVIGESASLLKYADIWFPWTEVAYGRDVSGTCTRGQCRGSSSFAINETDEIDLAVTEIPYTSSLSEEQEHGALSPDTKGEDADGDLYSW